VVLSKISQLGLTRTASGGLAAAKSLIEFGREYNVAVVVKEFKWGARREKLKFVFDINSIDGLQASAIIVGSLNRVKLPVIFLLNGVEVGIKILEKSISRKKSWPTGLMSNGFELRFGVLPALGHCFLTLQEAENCGEAFWDEFVEPATRVNGFIQAWISDVEYDFWQNVKDPLEYEGRGRSFSHLPQKSNGLPESLKEMDIDTSGNPGRSVLRQGYIEAIGRPIWLGDLFWKKVGRDKGASIELLEGRGFEVLECERTVKVVAFKEGFYDDSTIDEQRALRQILFGVNGVSV